MKRSLLIIFLSLIVLIVCAVPAIAQEETAGLASEGEEGAAGLTTESKPEYKPGIVRFEHHGESISYYLASDFAAKRDDVVMDSGMPLYQPAEPQPMNVYFVMSDDCMYSNSQFGMFSVAEKGSTYVSLLDWTSDFEDQSKGTLLFVTDPDLADILIVVNQQFPFYSTYYSVDNGAAVNAYACSVTFQIVRLTDPSQYTSLSLTQYPPDEVSLGSAHDFWEDPPEFSDTWELENCINTILGWYGSGSYTGSYGSGVKTAQQAMIDRGFLEGDADASFGPATESAVKRVQEAYGLEQSGAITDRETLMALYYSQEALDYMNRLFPE